MEIRVQPHHAQRDAWAALAQREGLCYETLEFALNPSACMDEDERILWYRESGRVRAVHGAFIDVNPASGDPDFAALSRRRCEQSCQLAQALGAKDVVFHASAFPFLRGAYLDHWADVCAAYYAQLSEKYALRLCIENSQDVDPDPLALLMRRAQGTNLCVCLDIGHAAYSRAPLEAWFDRLGEHIGCMHLSDNLGAFDDHLPIGQGAVDWALCDRLWRGLKADVPMTLEVGGLEGVRASLAYMQGNHYFGQGERR